MVPFQISSLECLGKNHGAIMALSVHNLTRVSGASPMKVDKKQVIKTVLKLHAYFLEVSAMNSNRSW